MSKITEISGVTPLMQHMCVNSCIAFTGPFSSLEECPLCNEARYKTIDGEATHNPRQEFYTIPIGPQLQALWRTKASAKAIRHRSECTIEILQDIQDHDGKINVYDDIYHGSDYLEAVRRGDITSDDMAVMFSMDGAQLYQQKRSDCWISIWVALDHAPDVRYQKKHVFPGHFIPGPNKPKIVDSFSFTGLHHLAALQKEGLMIWDALKDRVFKSHPFLVLATADGPGMTYLNGLTGHQGAYGCRLYCPTKGRHKPGANQYYPALLKPLDYTVEGCDHADVSARHIPPMSAAEYDQNLAYVMASPNETQFKKRRKATGISKPSLFSGLPSNRILGIPGCFLTDLMHLVSLNLTDLLLGLWRGTIDCNPTDDRATWDWAVLWGETWITHSKAVEDAQPYLPGSFGRPPRNPVEKISSGYKAWEFIMYIFVLGPGLLYGVLPDKYWSNFCKLIAGIRLLHQHSITREQLIEAHTLLIEFVEEFELLYYQRKSSRIHFCRQSLHGLLHIAPETIRVGPECYYSQWTMERTIGNLGEEIEQPSNPYTNLSRRGLLRSQTNALRVMIPGLDKDPDRLPRGALDLGGGLVLLRVKDECSVSISGLAGAAIWAYYH